jgi:hypothetical protein
VKGAGCTAGDAECWVILVAMQRLGRWCLERVCWDDGCNQDQAGLVCWQHPNGCNQDSRSQQHAQGLLSGDWLLLWLLARMVRRVCHCACLPPVCCTCLGVFSGVHGIMF